MEFTALIQFIVTKQQQKIGMQFNKTYMQFFLNNVTDSE